MSRRNSIADLDDDDLFEEGETPDHSPPHIPAVPEQAVIAQGRPRPALRLADLPEPEDVDASGPLSAEEEDLYNLCMRGVQEFKTAWWVLGKSMANMNSRHLYRKTHPTFEAWVKDTLGKSRATAYEEMTAYVVGELVSARADKAFEENSNEMSARADTPSISKKAASALNPVTQDYGAEVSVAVIETIQDATGKKVPVKTLTGIVQQLPRKAEEELTPEELTTRAHNLAAQSGQNTTDSHGNNRDSSTLVGLRHAVTRLKEAHRALAPAKVKQALDEAPDETTRLLADAKELAIEVTNRINRSSPA
ncbi:hypothetical protein [Streptomyces sp. NPDC056987]|uniref:hypothetical protein n=1 Tax=Streptomyces sp. NPDC056987 TaxID=3345988 RepID=UPI003636B474